MKQLKLGVKAKNYLRNFTTSLCRPNCWINVIAGSKSKRKNLILAILAFMSIGPILNMKWHFPCFIVFSSCFLFIGVLCLWAVSYFSKKMGHITAAIANQPAAKKANLFYFRHGVESSLYFFVPIMVILIFGLGCCSMFGAIQLTPTFIWMLVLFFAVVYISIIGYLQYIVLAIYIRNLTQGAGGYRNFPKAVTGCIPAQLEWVQMLTKLSHVYRSVFFTLGAAYTVGYGAFCWLPEMQANTSSFVFFLLWGIIFLAIIFLFPIISVLEYRWIKILVEQLKLGYIEDLAVENDINAKNEIISSTLAIQGLIQSICATQILNSKDYPLKSAWETSYAALLSAFNFTAAVVTIMQCLPIRLSELLHIL